MTGLHVQPSLTFLSSLSVADINNDCHVFGSFSTSDLISFAYPYDKTRSASSTIKVLTVFGLKFPAARCFAARNGVDTMISGHSLSHAFWVSKLSLAKLSALMSSLQ